MGCNPHTRGGSRDRPAFGHKPMLSVIRQPSYLNSPNSRMGQFRDNFVEIPDFVFFFGKIEILFSRIDTNAISQFKRFQSQHFLENFGHFLYNRLAEKRVSTEFVLKIPEFLSQNSFFVVYKSGATGGCWSAP